MWKQLSTPLLIFFPTTKSPSPSIAEKGGEMKSLSPHQIIRQPEVGFWSVSINRVRLPDRPATCSQHLSEKR
jgi:hypothetical protein